MTKDVDDDVMRRVNQTMLATTIAFILRSASDSDRRQLINELRRNILLTMADVALDAEPATVLAHEESTDALLDQIQHIANLK